jgi:hypothetical protein
VFLNEASQIPYPTDARGRDDGGFMRSMLGAAREYLADSFSWEQPFAHKPFHDFEDFERELKWRIERDNAFAIVGISLGNIGPARTS